MNLPIRCLAILMILLVAGFLAGSNSLGPRAFGEEPPAESPSKKETKKEKKEAKEKEKEAKAAEKAKKEQAELFAKEQEAKEIVAIAENAKQQQQEWAKKLKVPVETKSKSGIELVLIPPDGQIVLEPYWIGKYEVTQTEWNLVKWKSGETNQSINPSVYQGDKEEVRGMDTSRFPVEFASWNWCIAYCNCLSTLEGLDPYYGAVPRPDGAPNDDFLMPISRRTTEIKILGGNGYHLPTSNQWEYACRAGTMTPYYFGSTTEKIGDYAWYAANSEKHPHPVGLKKPNGFGLYDMAGNVGEWTEETFPKMVEVNGQPVTKMYIASRGGSHLWSLSKCMSAATFDQTESASSWAVGLRVVRSATPQAKTEKKPAISAKQMAKIDTLFRENSYFQIQFVASKKNLGISGLKDDNARVILAPSNDNQGQQWKFVKAGDFYKIVNRKTGKALNVANGSNEENAEIIQWDAADDSENQQWLPILEGEQFLLKARHSGLVLDVVEDPDKRKATVVQAKMREGRRQTVELVPVKE